VGVRHFAQFEAFDITEWPTKNQFLCYKYSAERSYVL